MMDYEYQPANHLSFRLAQRVVVPDAFPDWALRRFGARPTKVVRYAGFKEELYLAEIVPDPTVLDTLALDTRRIIAVFRPPPDGALYHGFSNDRFDDLLARARARADVDVVLLPRTRDQAGRYEQLDGIVVPATPVDGPSLLAAADLVIGAGGTMNRESALLGTPTYTVFAGRLAAVDAELVRAGLLNDLRGANVQPRFEKKVGARGPIIAAERRTAIVDTVARTLEGVAVRS
jgi:predicted glycosyltransferase